MRMNHVIGAEGMDTSSVAPVAVVGDTIKLKNSASIAINSAETICFESGEGRREVFQLVE